MASTLTDVPVSQKSLEACFHDWEASVFGFGYGSGEQHTLGALKSFFTAVGKDDMPTAYDYRILEAELGAQVAWLMINLLCREDIIEYGCSPRFGWLTRQGIALMAFVQLKTLKELYDITSDNEFRDRSCMKGSCNCGPRGYVDGRVCPNPFFNDLWVEPTT